MVLQLHALQILQNKKWLNMLITELACINGNYTYNTAKTTRSEKAKAHTISKAVLVSPTGRLYGVGKSRQPKSDLSNTVMQDFLEVLLQLKESETVGGDPAYIGLADYVACHVVTSYKKPPGCEKTTDQKKWNNEFKSIRTVVENYFAQIKDFKILRYPWRCKGELEQILEKHHSVWIICAALLSKYLFPEGIKELPVYLNFQNFQNFLNFLKKSSRSDE